MPSPRLLRRAATPFALGLVGILVAGCGADTTATDDPTPQSPAPSGSTAGSEDSTPTPDQPPTSSAPLPTAAPGSGLAGRLLTAAELPTPGPGKTWKTVRTGKSGSKAFGPCARYDVLTIGALAAVETRWKAGSDTGAEQIANFPDRTNTQRAAQVLAAWHDRCGERVDAVTDTTDAQVPHGQASYYRVEGGESGDGSFGTVVAGHRIALLWFPGGIPSDRMTQTLRAASSKLG